MVVTPTNSVGSGCGCGGISYIGVFGTVNATAHQPTWIFTAGSGTGGYDVGQIISHEVGHTFGLSHDGTGQSSYHAGAKGWAPIMGSSYGKRASHWSSGEYAAANYPEDDTAVIARTAPVLPDDHDDGVVDRLRHLAAARRARRVDWRLPRGLRWTVVGDRVVIRGRARRSSAGRFAAVLSGDGGSVRRVFRLVVR